MIVPEVFPIISAGSKDSSLFSIGCLVYKYFPEPIEVTWKTTAGEIPQNVKNIPSGPLSMTSSYSLVSIVTINNTDFDNKTYQCNVQHFSSNIQKTIPRKRCEPPPPEFPTVHLLQGSCPESTNGQVELTCQVYNLTSQDATVKWYINDQEEIMLQQDSLELGKSKNHFFVLYTTVSISQAKWNTGAEVKCHVTDKGTGKSAESKIRKCSDNFNCLGINVFMVRPTVEELYVHNTARIRCVASNLKDTNGYTFNWSYPGASNALNVLTEDPLLEQNGTYSVTSVLTAPTDAWVKHNEFTCIFSHVQLPTPIIVRIKKEQGTKNTPPIVAVSHPSPEEEALKEVVTLVCIAINHYPEDIYMNWRTNGMDVSQSSYVTTESKPHAGGQHYSTVSILTIPADSWENNINCECIVGHEAIPLNFTKRSIDKNSGKPTVVNVSVTMSDSTLSCS